MTRVLRVSATHALIVYVDALSGRSNDFHVERVAYIHTSRACVRARDLGNSLEVIRAGVFDVH